MEEKVPYNELIIPIGKIRAFTPELKENDKDNDLPDVKFIYNHNCDYYINSDKFEKIVDFTRFSYIYFFDKKEVDKYPAFIRKILDNNIGGPSPSFERKLVKKYDFFVNDCDEYNNEIKSSLLKYVTNYKNAKFTKEFQSSSYFKLAHHQIIKIAKKANKEKYIKVEDLLKCAKIVNEVRKKAIEFYSNSEMELSKEQKRELKRQLKRQQKQDGKKDNENKKYQEALENIRKYL